MKVTELRKKPAADLQQEVARIEMELMRYRAQTATGGAGKDAGKIRELKRTIARIKTIQHTEVKGKQ